MWPRIFRKCLVSTLYISSLTILSGQTAADWDSARVHSIAQKLRCPCGCNLSMSCQMPPHPCPTCKRNRVAIYRMLTEGRTEKEILDRYVAEGGPGMLWVTPGLLGRTGPYLVLALGSGLVVIAILRFRRADPLTPQLDSATQSLIEKDIAEMDA